MFTDLLGQLAVVAVFVQRVLGLVKSVYETSQYSREITIALSVVSSSALCVAWQIDAFAVAGIALPLAWLGSALTGLFAGLGSNVVNSFIELLEMWKNQKEVEVEISTGILADERLDKNAKEW